MKRFFKDKVNFVLRTEPYIRPVHRLVLVIEAIEFEFTKHQVDQAPRFRRALLHALHPVEHHYNTLPVTVGRPHEAIAGFRRVPCFQAVGALRSVYQRVPVSLLDAVIGEVLFCKHRIQFRIFISRKFPDQCSCQDIQVARRGVLLEMGPACRVPKHGVFHAEFPGDIVHFLSKAFFGAGNAFSDRYGGIISGLHHHAIKQIPHRDFLSNFHEGLGPALAPRFLGNQECVIKRQASVRNSFKGDIDGHDLGHRRRLHQRIRLLFHQHLSGTEVSYKRKFR